MLTYIDRVTSHLLNTLTGGAVETGFYSLLRALVSNLINYVSISLVPRDARLILIRFLGTMICFESPFDSRVLLNKHAISLCQNESPLVIISGNWIQELDSVLLIHMVNPSC